MTTTTTVTAPELAEAQAAWITSNFNHLQKLKVIYDEISLLAISPTFKTMSATNQNLVKTELTQLKSLVATMRLRYELNLTV